MVKNKKGISPMIGYILLISFGIVISIIVFNYLQTYVPREMTKCPDGTSMSLRDYSYDCGLNQLNISLKNNGRFNIGGFFIHVSNDSNVRIATTDLSKYLEDQSGRIFGNAIVVNLRQENLIKPNDEINYIFNIPSEEVTDIKILEIKPMRFEEENNRFRPITCTSSIIREIIKCNN